VQIIKEHTVHSILFSTDKRRLDVKYIHQFLSNDSYWAKGIPLKLVQRSIENSLTIGVYEAQKQIGFARVITDYATFGYLADVFIDAEYRARGLSKTLMEFIVSIDELKDLRRILLATRDAHSLYVQYGFKPLGIPDSFMELHQPGIYKKYAP